MMNRIDVAKLKFLRIEPRGRGVVKKFWISHKGKNKLVKISEPSMDQDMMEYLSYLILREIHIPCVSVELGYDSDSSKNCCLIDSYLEKEGDVSYEMIGWNYEKGKTTEELIQRCIQQVFEKYASLFHIDRIDYQKIQSDYIRIILGKCIINNFDAKLENIGIIYNEIEDSYRLPPSFDNGFSFKDYNAILSSTPICFIGDQFFGIDQILKYILEFHYEEVKDIIAALEEFVSDKLDRIVDSLEEIPLAKREYIKTYITNMNHEIQQIKENRRKL